MPNFDQTLPLPKPQPDDNGSDDSAARSKAAALEIVRKKVDTVYDHEPSALQEEQEILAEGSHSKHQDFIKKLMDSGKDLADIQTAWHSYYQTLPDTEKHQVWNDFYAHYGHTVHQKTQRSHTTTTARKQSIIQQDPAHLLQAMSHQALGKGYKTPPHSSYQKKSVPKTRQELLDTVTARGKLKPKHHIQSLLFGLSMGLVVVTIVMFSFFNERFIAPFITPSKTASASPIIIDPGQQVGPESKVIIPKINVDVPVVYDVGTNDEKAIQDALERGVVHYPGTAVPGQNGNVVVVGHSSNNLLNRGKYKFAFVLLNRLQVGDTITMQYGGKRYVYKVYETVIVKPTDVGVLGPTDKTASLTLITCDPPGTSLNRLVVKAEQISPAPTANLAAADPAISENVPEVVPGNAPSLFDRLFGWL